MIYHSVSHSSTEQWLINYTENTFNLSSRYHSEWICCKNRNWLVKMEVWLNNVRCFLPNRIPLASWAIPLEFVDVLIFLSLIRHTAQLISINLRFGSFIRFTLHREVQNKHTKVVFNLRSARSASKHFLWWAIIMAEDARDHRCTRFTLL